MAWYLSWNNSLIAYSHLILIVRSFVTLQYQPRLAMVTSTLEATTMDLLHFLLVFFPTFVAFAACGHTIFGRRLEEFATIEAAVGTCFKIAMESEFQWQRLSASEGEWFTA